MRRPREVTLAWSLSRSHRGGAALPAQRPDRGTPGLLTKRFHAWSEAPPIPEAPPPVPAAQPGSSPTHSPRPSSTAPSGPQLFHISPPLWGVALSEAAPSRGGPAPERCPIRSPHPGLRPSASVPPARSGPGAPPRLASPRPAFATRVAEARPCDPSSEPLRTWRCEWRGAWGPRPAACARPWPPPRPARRGSGG
jgi:hypothetical protein